MLNAKKAAQLRTKQLDSKRQKLKNDLEEREKRAREQGAAGSYKINKTPEELFQEEFERLRKEGSKLLEEEQEFMRQQLHEEKVMQSSAKSNWDPSKHRIKIRWKATSDDPANGGYSEAVLNKFLSKYGDINVLVMSPKKNGSALVEFKTQEAAEMAVSYEKGRLDNACTLEWIGDAPKNKNSRTGGSSTVTERDFESLVLRQLRQAEERKRLIEQMMQEDAEEQGSKG